MVNRPEDADLEQLLHAINHDLRTPLSNIRSAISILLQDITDPLTEDQRKFVEIIDDSTLRLLDQSNRLMLLNQIAFGQLHLEAVPVSELLANVRRTLKNNYEIEEINFLIEGDPQLHCDNYVLSATIAMLAAGDTKRQIPRASMLQPTIQTTVANGAVSFAVHSVMPADALAASFQQLTSEIIQAHNGQLAVSEAENRKLFSFTIPLAP